MHTARTENDTARKRLLIGVTGAHYGISCPAFHRDHKADPGSMQGSIHAMGMYLQRDSPVDIFFKYRCPFGHFYIGHLYSIQRRIHT